MKTTIMTFALALGTLTFAGAQTPAPAAPGAAASKPAAAAEKTAKKHHKKAAKKTVKAPAASTAPVKQ